MLVDQDDADIFPLPRELVECRLDGIPLSLAVAYQEVSLCIWRIGDVTNAREKETGDGTGIELATAVIHAVSRRR